MYTLWGTLTVLGLCVVLHEFGHLLAAKMFGVDVHVFSFGFGKRLCGFKWGNTDCRISLIPLGGYVKLEGENPTEQQDNPKSFQNISRWRKIVVYAAGPAFSFLLGVFLLSGLYAIHWEEPAYLKQPPMIGLVDDRGLGYKTGLRKGDLIYAVNEKDVTSWEQALSEIFLNAKQGISLTVDRGGELVVVMLPEVDAGPDETLERLGVYPFEEVVLDQVAPDSPAQKAGFKSGDSILALNRSMIFSRMDFIRQLQTSTGNREVEIMVIRDYEIITLRVYPEFDENEKRYKIGITMKDQVVVSRLPVYEAVYAGLKESYKMFEVTYKSVQKMVSGSASTKNMQGPVGIAKISGQAAERGWSELLKLTAVISVSIGIFNLFPFIPLDGGFIFLFGLEVVLRRNLSDSVRAVIQWSGMIVIFALMLFVIYNDLAPYFGL